MTGSDPRRTACDILTALDTGIKAGRKQTLDNLIENRFDPSFKLMNQRDRNFTYAIVYGVLRTRGKLDWVIGQSSKGGLKKIDPYVLNILRMALFQVMNMSRVPASAAVNTAVSLAKTSSPPWVVGFVNGLLRGAVRNLDTIKWPQKDPDPLVWLSVEASFPRWIIQRWANRFGFEQTGRLCRFFNEIPPLCLRTNTLKASRDQLIDALRDVSAHVAPSALTPEGVVVSGLEESLQEMAVFQDGWFQVQDEAAQLVARAVAPRPGETVLDACAGLGGKTGHLAQLMANRGVINVMDNHPGRLEKLVQQMTRLGIAIVNVFNHDLNQSLDQKHRALYDRVLIDAPCSGMGVIRRNPDTRWLLAPGDLDRFREKQLKYLENVSAAVRPGGTLVYSVCSIEPEETDDVVAGFLKTHSGYARLALSGIVDVFSDQPEDTCEGIRILPHIHRTDGFFIAAFKKNE